MKYQDTERLKQQLRNKPQLVPRVLNYLNLHYERGAYQVTRKSRWRYIYVPSELFHHIVLLALVGLAVLENEDEEGNNVQQGVCSGPDQRSQERAA